MAATKKLKVYEYSNCSTCKSALKFLEREGVAFEAVPIVDQPPSVAELRRMLGYVGELKMLFNLAEKGGAVGFKEADWKKLIAK